VLTSFGIKEAVLSLFGAVGIYLMTKVILGLAA
jgi:hypothetical protein